MHLPTALLKRKNSSSLLGKMVSCPTRGQAALCCQLTILAALLAACLPTPPSQVHAPWKYADLRQIDPVDASQPGLDLVAAYTRRLGGELQIRLDLLDLAPVPDFDLYLALDTSPGGSRLLPFQMDGDLEWDALLVIPASGLIEVLRPASQTGDPVPLSQSAVRVLRDPILDTLEISLSAGSLAEATLMNPSLDFSLQAFLTPAGTREPADVLGPLRVSGPPPPAAPVLFAFWNSLPAYSPALALRRWDGAHTGPEGGRHGLYNLLRTARGARTPLVLLDLKAPASLSALDYSGGLNMVRNMVGAGLLVLPEVLPASSLPDGFPAGWVITSREADQAFRLPPSGFRYAQNGLSPGETGAGVVFAPVPSSQAGLAPVHFQRWGGQRVIPIPLPASGDEPVTQATEAGPSLELRQALVQAALSASPGDIPGRSPVLILGGDLPASTWGIPAAARATFDYLAGRPWIRILDAHDLLASRPAQGATPVELSPSLPLPPVLHQVPHNLAGLAAWQAYQSLVAPVNPRPPELQALRENYLGQVGSLLAAAAWAEDPAPLATCAVDPDGDGRPECILASAEVFALFEPEGGALAYLFGKQGGAVHQLVAPSSQFSLGLSEPSGWDLSRGLAADPAVIPGAFVGPGEGFQPALGPDWISFTSPDGSLVKTFRLATAGIQVGYSTAGAALPDPVRVPLALDPWERFSLGYADRYELDAIPQGWSWGLEGGVRLEVQADIPLTAHDFTESLRFLEVPEDPNRDYPPGHFLPFPLALVEAAASGDFEMSIRLSTQ